MDPAKTLQSILLIIDKDVKRIKKEILTTRKKNKTLPPEMAITLARYANTLNAIVDEGWKAKEKAKKNLEKKTTEELVKLYLDSKPKETPNDPI